MTTREITYLEAVREGEAAAEDRALLLRRHAGQHLPGRHRDADGLPTARHPAGRGQPPVPEHRAPARPPGGPGQGGIAEPRARHADNPVGR